MKILAVDYGDVRSGLAVSDISEFLASPQGTIKAEGLKSASAKIAEAAKANGAEKIIVGLPKNMDGSEGDRAKKCRKLAETLSKMGFVTEMADERLSTMAAAQHLNATNTRGKKRKDAIDAASAVVILQSYLDKNRGGK